MLPPHITQTLADLDTLIADLMKTAQTLRVVYTLEPIAAVDAPAVAAPRPRKTTPAPREVPAVERKPKVATRQTTKADPRAGSKYDEGILRALKTEAAAFGLSCGDITRTFTGPGKPADVEKLNPLVWSALKSLVKRGQVRKDGRHYYIVRAHDREAGVQ